MIVVEELFKSFNKVNALDGLNIRVPKGINGLIGPNGAGKTTLIHVLTGLIKPDSGRVEVMGLEPWSQRYELMRKVGVLLERPVFPTNVSGMRYMLHVIRVMGLPEKEAVEALRKVGLLNHADRKVSGYSSGMKIRLGLAKAIVGRPELVILDEPTSNLDPRGRIELLKLIKTMHRDEDISFLISSHVLPELQRVCSWVCLMNEGRAIEQGFIDDLLDKYASKIYAIRVSKPRELAEALSGLNGLKVRLVKDTVYIKGDASIFLQELLNLVIKTGNEILGFHQFGRSLENVFLKALEEERHES
ncbi:MAG: ABC transporter ATP-binding protein [Candidatus Brockarchaeota archaeon]|nr:ABC transporter ATP-binding protein [Candidatus Brockarchaeota archaeon]